MIIEGMILFAIILGIFLFIVALRQSPRMQRVSVFGYIGLLALFYVTITEAMGTSKPLNFEWRDLVGGKVLAYAIRQDVAIYLWVQRGDQPVAYVLPWSDEESKEVGKAWNDAVVGGVEVLMGDNTDGLDTREPVVHPAPPVAHPVKDYTDSDPVIPE